MASGDAHYITKVVGCRSIQISGDFDVGYVFGWSQAIPHLGEFGGSESNDAIA